MSNDINPEEEEDAFFTNKIGKLIPIAKFSKVVVDRVSVDISTSDSMLNETKEQDKKTGLF